MDINRSNLNELFQGFNLLFQRGIDTAHPDYLKFSTEINSSTAVEVYPFLERFGGMHEWIGDRKLNNVSTKKYEVANKSYEDNVVVSRNDLEDDRYDIYAPMLQEMGANAAALWGELAVQALQDGFTAKWLDGKTFFNASHKYGDNTISNFAAAALSVGAYETARLTMRQYKAHNGKVIANTPTLLIVGPSNEKLAREILSGTLRISSAAQGGATGFAAVDNPWKGSAELLVLEQLDTEWMLANVSRPIKPVIVQKRKAPKLVRLDREEDDNVFNRAEVIYGTDARGAAFLTLPHLIYGGKPA